VTELIGTAAGHGARLAVLEAARGRAPLIGSADRPTSDAFGVPGDFDSPADEARRAETPWTSDALLKVRPLGNMAGDKWEGRQLFDDKLMVQAEYMYDGVKGGVAWKGKLSRYFITKVPALGDILKWAEKHGKDEVSEDAFDTVAGHFVDKPKQDAINAAIWGFLAGCLSGPADTHFKKADDCNGLDAW
jgi:hypothetical protein